MREVEPSPLTLAINEHGTLLTSSLSRDQAQRLHVGFGKYLDASPGWEPGWTELKAKQYVGLISLPDVRVVIRPKVPLDNLFYMLTYAYGLPELRPEEAGLSQAEELFEFVAGMFISRVERLVRRGIYRRYVTSDHNEPYLRGQLQVAGHLRLNTVQPQRFYQQVSEFTADVQENRILHYTLAMLSRLNLSRHLRGHLRQATAAFTPVALTPIKSSDCLKVNYNRLNRHYQPHIHLAHLLLQHLSVEYRSGETPFFAFLFDMNQVYERFVARLLEERLAVLSPSLSIQIQPTIWIDAEQREQRTPDIVLWQEGRRQLILDTKYKVFARSPSADDLHQMVTYCYSMGVTSGTLIYPNDLPFSYYSRISEVALRAVNLSLAGELNRFKENCDRFVRDLVDSAAGDE